MQGNTNHIPEAVERFLDSTLDSVDSAEELAVGLAQRAGMDDDDLMKIGMAIRESMVNAVVHGNRYSANKTVHFQVVCSERGIEIVIQDQGQGFLAETQLDPLAKENLMNQSGRGLALIRAFTDELVVEPAQPSGTRVILRKFLPPEVG